MNHIKNIWKCFEEKHATFAKWLYQIFYFVIFSMGVTVFQYLVFTFLPGILGIGLAGTEFMWPKVSMNLFGVKFTWSLLGYNVLRDATGNILIGGGLGYFISYELGSFLAQCINFPLQRNITFKSHGNPVYQAIWYFIAWVVISLICNGFNNLWMPVASAYVAPAVYNMLVTIITGGVSMVIFFFVFKTINEQISNFAQTYPTNLKASSNEALLFMRRYRFANCSCFSCCFKDAYPSSNVQ